MLWFFFAGETLDIYSILEKTNSSLEKRKQPCNWEEDPVEVIDDMDAVNMM